MFGIVEQPCRGQTADRREWMAHLCGLCLTLRDRHGQLSRVTTNRDTVLLSALYEAQAGEAPVRRTRAGPCPLRQFKPADVVEASTAGVRFASAVTLLLASVAVDDKVADGELGRALVRRPAARLGGRWRRQALAEAADLGFDGTAILDIVGQQAALEATPGLAFADYAGPTERSVAAAFRHTAVLAGRDGNAAGLDGAGRMFGRIAYLLDAWEDRDSDRRHGRFNALDAAAVEAEEGRHLFRDAHGDLRRHLDTVDLPRPALVRFLLVDGLHRAGRRVLFGERHGHVPTTDRDGKPPRWVTGLLGGWAASVGACGTCVVCVHGVREACDDACDEVCDEACADCDCDCNCDGCDCSGCDCSNDCNCNC